MWISCLLHVNSFELPPGFIGIQAVERASHHCTQESEARIDQAACKPVSVHRSCERIGDHYSGTTLAYRLAQPTRTERYGAPVPAFAGTPVPIRSCSRRGLPCRSCFQKRGALLPHPFTLASRRTGIGGLLSVALSLGSVRRPHRAGVTRRHAIVEPGLSSSTPSRENGLPAVARPPDRSVMITYFDGSRDSVRFVRHGLGPVLRQRGRSGRLTAVCHGLFSFRRIKPGVTSPGGNA